MKRTLLYLPLSILPLLCLHAQSPGSGPDAAAQQLAAIKAGDGLEVSLFASEPMIVNPADMDIDAKGRVWITEGANYRVWQKWGKLRPGGDRIVVLEDTNGDGSADKETVFYQGEEINTALGICVLGNKVIVSRSPDVFVFTDDNGDGKADKKELLFTGLSGVDHDHGVHAFVFGPDGKLYFNFGNEGKQIKRPDGSPVLDRFGNEVNNKGNPYRQGMIFRCNIDGSDFEVLAHNFRNNYEVAVDSFGGMWQSDNDDDGNKGVRINYILDWGNYGYTDEMNGKGWSQKRVNWENEIPLRHWHLNDPGVVPNLLQTGAGAPTGILVYEGKALPERFHGQVIHCDSGARVVRAYPVEKDGAGYKAAVDNILTADDSPAGKWFRPSDACVAPDGSLYVADWNDAGVGGHMMADQKLETMTGRVYRVAPKGKKLDPPRLKFDNAKDCVTALQSPNQDARYQAWTKLHAMQDKAESELTKLRKDKDPRIEARAFHLLAGIKGKEQKYIDDALADQNEDIRCAALRHIRSANMDSIPAVKKLANDPSPAVRRECALSLHHSKSPEAAALWTQLAKQYDGKDRWYLEALGIGAEKNEDVFFNAWFASVGDKWNTPAGRDIVWRSRAKKTPALLAQVITDKSTPQSEKDRFMRAMDFQTGPEKEQALLQIVTAQTDTK
jgi:putative membrane-bound dehydrogenase-like protein